MAKAKSKGVQKYEFNSLKLKARLERDGWQVVRVQGDHHVMKHPTKKVTLVLVHPKKDLPLGTVKQIYKSAGWE